MQDIEMRNMLITACRGMVDAGLNSGKSGNVSMRCQQGMLISPSGIAVDRMCADDVVYLPFDADVPGGQRAPSSEWQFHRDLLLDRSEFNCILHAHSPKATALAVHGRGIPPFHYMVAIAGGADVRCAPYALFGTRELSDYVVDAMQGRRACLLAHHGIISAGEHLETAFAVLQEIEHLAGIYLDACQLGEPPLLSEQEMRVVIERFETYGQQRELNSI